MARIRFSLAALMGVVFLAALGLVALRNASTLWANATFTVILTLLLCAVLGLIFRRNHARAFWLGFALFGWTYFLLVNAPWLETHVGPRLITNAALNRLHKSVLRAQAERSDPDHDGIINLADVTVDNPNVSSGSIILTWRQLRLPVGRPRILRAAFRIKRVQVMDENILDLSPLVHPNDIQLLARTPGSTYLSLWDVNNQWYTVSVTAVGAASVPNDVHFHQVGHSLFALLFALLGGYVARCFYTASEK